MLECVGVGFYVEPYKQGEQLAACFCFGVVSFSVLSGFSVNNISLFKYINKNVCQSIVQHCSGLLI